MHSPLFDEKEKATILYADRVTRAATTIRAAELEEMHEYFVEGQIVELTLTIRMANVTTASTTHWKISPRVAITPAVRQYRCECDYRSMDADRPTLQNDRVVEAIRNRKDADEGGSLPLGMRRDSLLEFHWPH